MPVARRRYATSQHSNPPDHAGGIYASTRARCQQNPACVFFGIHILPAVCKKVTRNEKVIAFSSSGCLGILGCWPCPSSPANIFSTITYGIAVSDVLFPNSHGGSKFRCLSTSLQTSIFHYTEKILNSMPQYGRNSSQPHILCLSTRSFHKHLPLRVPLSYQEDVPELTIRKRKFEA